MIRYSNMVFDLEEDLCKNVNRLVTENELVVMTLKDFTVPYMSLIGVGMTVDWELFSDILLEKYKICHTIIKSGTSGLIHHFYKRGE